MATTRRVRGKAKLGRAEQDRLVREVQYLNLAEMRAFCGAHDLPMYIHVEGEDGRLRRTGDRDRKDVVLARILELALRGKRLGPTVYARRVVADGPLPKELNAKTRVHYGQYEKHNERFVAKLRELTGGAFKTGMIARLVLRDSWTAGEAPTLRAFADAWLVATAEHTHPRPEGAYLVDLWKGEAGPGWKKRRTQNARSALATLEELVAAHARA